MTEAKPETLEALETRPTLGELARLALLRGLFVGGPLGLIPIFARGSRFSIITFSDGDARSAVPSLLAALFLVLLGGGVSAAFAVVERTTKRPKTPRAFARVLAVGLLAGLAATIPAVAQMRYAAGIVEGGAISEGLRALDDAVGHAHAQTRVIGIAFGLVVVPLAVGFALERARAVLGVRAFVGAVASSLLGFFVHLSQQTCNDPGIYMLFMGALGGTAPLLEDAADKLLERFKDE